MAELCDGCWKVLADQIALAEGATATPRPEPDADDVTWIEPPVCRLCGCGIRVFPTVYDRWVSLGTAELPAKDVPARFRWRLVEIRGPFSSVPVDIVAVRIRCIDPLPGEFVVPAHQMSCGVDEAEESPAAKGNWT